MAVPLVVPVQALYGAVQTLPPPPPPPPPVRWMAPPCPTTGLTACPADDCLRFDRMLERRAIAEIERLRNELGASDMALEAARGELRRDWIERALDRRATVAEADAAAARHAAGSDSFSRPVPGTIADIDERSGLAADRPAADDATSVTGRGAAPLVGATETTVVRSRSMIDLFA